MNTLTNTKNNFMDNKIPKYWSEQYKRFTGLDATYEDYMKNRTLFKPETLFDENPV